MRARSLEAENWLGTTNPYIQVTVGKQKAIYYPEMSFKNMFFKTSSYEYIHIQVLSNKPFPSSMFVFKINKFALCIPWL